MTGVVALRASYVRVMDVKQSIEDLDSQSPRVSGEELFDGREMAMVHTMLRREFGLSSPSVLRCAAGQAPNRQIER